MTSTTTAPHGIRHGMRTFLVIWVGQMISLIGSQLTGFGLGVWVYEQNSSATEFALNLVAFILPSIIFAPIAGMIVDRYDRRLVLIGSDLLAGVSTISVLALYATGNLEIWHVYVATFLNAVATTFQWPAFGAATTMLVPKEHLGRASGMTQAAEAISVLLGPGIAGAIYVTIGMRALFAIDILSFAFAIGTMLFVRIPPPERTMTLSEHTGLRGFVHEALFGLRYLRERPGLLGIMLVFAACNFAVNIPFALFNPMILDQSTPDILGYLQSVMGIGMVVGTLLLSGWGGPKRRIFGVAFGDMLTGLFVALMGVSPSFIIIALGGFLIGISGPIANGSNQALWQSKVAADVQGRVFSVRRMIAFSIIPIAYLLAGPLADHVFKPALMPGGALADTLIGQVLGVGPGRGIGLMFIIGGIAHTLFSTIHLLHPRIRRVELELPDAVTEEVHSSQSSVDSVPLTAPVAVVAVTEN